MKTLSLLMLFLLPLDCMATTWAESKVDDPIKPGSKCSVSEPASWGDYIYNWPSKYDQVFWPFTDSNAIWFCKKSGYVSFMADFEEINDAEKEAIKKYLEKNRLKKPSVEDLLIVLEKIYELRNVEPEYRNMLLRVFARWYQEFGELKKANEYRKRALEGIKGSLKQELSEGTRLEYLYLASSYSRQFGFIEESDSFRSNLIDAIENMQDSELKGYGEYLRKLSNEIDFIEPGGRIDPEMPGK